MIILLYHPKLLFETPIYYCNIDERKYLFRYTKRSMELALTISKILLSICSFYMNKSS